MMYSVSRRLALDHLMKRCVKSGPGGKTTVGMLGYSGSIQRVHAVSFNQSVFLSLLMLMYSLTTVTSTHASGETLKEKLARAAPPRGGFHCIGPGPSASIMTWETLHFESKDDWYFAHIRGGCLRRGVIRSQAQWCGVLITHPQARGNCRLNSGRCHIDDTTPLSHPTTQRGRSMRTDVSQCVSHAPGAPQLISCAGAPPSAPQRVSYIPQRDVLT